jgi:VCBS repeat-containing protein
VIDNGAQGIRLTDIEDANLSQLTITGNDVGVEIKDYIHAFDLTNSFVNDNRIGFYVNELYHNFGLTVFDNDLSGNSEYAILNGDTGASNTVRPVGASGNWFGSTDETVIAASLSGLVDFTPYLATGTDTSPDTGFQGDFSTLYVTTLGEQTTILIGRLQQAVDLATSSGIIIMNSGVYNEDVTVNENKILKGTGTVTGTITTIDTAQFLPGNSPGMVTMTNLVGSAGTNFTADIDGTTPGTEYDQLVVTDHVTLNGMFLIGNIGYEPNAGDTITLIDNQGTDAIEGTFDGMNEGDVITLDGCLATVTYTGGDGNDMQVIFNGLNTAPVADDVQAVAVEDGKPVTVAFNGSDADLDGSVNTLSYQFLSLPGEGTVTNNGNGTFTFNPGRAFQDLGIGETRQVSFTYKVTDQHGVDSAAGTIIITVNGTNDYPVAAPNLVSTEYQSAIDIDVLRNDVDIDGDILHVSRFETPTSNLGVTMSINPDGTVHYDPTGLFDSLAPGQTVRDSFRYFATDPYGLSDQHLVFVDVTRPVTMTSTSTTTAVTSSSPSSVPNILDGAIVNPITTPAMSPSGNVGVVHQAALAWASNQAQLHVMPVQSSGSTWLSHLTGSSDDEQTGSLLSLIEVDA